ncbi:hypothetical protein D5S17_13020 [Pseudonocardiaceae bacterium YIM PH 21723]|nr:hypothetical protein D5S17_13020 [Pseudonocardiaceae bacterium YIM PH 21723]
MVKRSTLLVLLSVMVLSGCGRSSLHSSALDEPTPTSTAAAPATTPKPPEHLGFVRRSTGLGAPGPQATAVPKPVRLPRAVGTADNERAAFGKQFVVALAQGTGFQAWHTGDSGANWEPGTLDATLKAVRIDGVTHTDRRWLAYGSAQGSPLLLESTDGLKWRRLDTSPLGSAEITAVTADSELIVAGRSAGCTNVWTGDSGSWRTARLSCADTLTTAHTLSDGRVLLSGTREAWVR